MSILIIAPNWLGDAMMALPAIRDLRRHFAGQPLAVAARPSIAPVFRAVPDIDRLIVLEKGREAAQLSADIGILLPNSFRSAWTLVRARVKERWGYRTDFRRPLLTRGVRTPRRRVSFPEYYQNLVRQLGVETGPATAQLRLQEPAREAARGLLERYGWKGEPLAGIAPGAAFGRAKQWLPERYAELSIRLRAAGVSPVLLGRAEDRASAQHVEGIDLIGQTDVPLLMGVIAHCHVVVANDSGALHLAGALGVPVVGIWGPTHERYSTPVTPFEDGRNVAAVSAEAFCRPCFLAECPIDHRCMKRISTDRVYGAVVQFARKEPA